MDTDRSRSSTDDVSASERTSRRALLGTAGATTLTLLSGCTGSHWWRDGDDESTGDGNGEGSDGSEEREERSEDDDVGTGGGTDESADESDDSDGKDSDGNTDDPTHYNEDEDEPGPSEEDTEIDREKYERQEDQGELQERNSSDVDLSENVAVHDTGTVEAIGTVENVSEETITAVELELVAYGSDDDEVGSQLETLRGLEPGDSRRFGISIDDEILRGDAEEAMLEMTVYDRV